MMNPETFHNLKENELLVDLDSGRIYQVETIVVTQDLERYVIAVNTKAFKINSNIALLKEKMVE